MLLTINQSSIFWNKKVFNLVLNASTVPDCCTSIGNPFQILGPATLKDLSAKVLALVKGILYRTLLSW